MEVLRKNDKEEKLLIYGVFKRPILTILFLIIISLSLSTFMFSSLRCVAIPFGLSLLISFLFFFLFFIFIPPLINCKKSICMITNKRIYGQSVLYFSHQYCYRLDQIENITYTRFCSSLTLYFSNGTLSHNTTSFRIFFLQNGQELYSKLTKLLTSTKNDMDLIAHAETKKISAQEQQARAVQSIAENFLKRPTPQTETTEKNYIQQLEDLHDLFKKGIITQEEFDEKKKQILQL